jgi:hypothetical protein
MKKILLGLIVFIALISSCYAINTNPLTDYRQLGINGELNYVGHTGYTGNALTSYVLDKNRSDGTPYELMVADFDNDGAVEIAYVSNGDLKLMDASFIPQDSFELGTNSSITAVPSGCGGIANHWRLFVRQRTGANKFIASYCVDSGNVLVAENVTTMRLRDYYIDEYGCNNASDGHWGCFIASYNGFTYCGMDKDRIICTEYASTDIKTVNYSQIPAVKDLDNDTILDAVFYGYNGATSYIEANKQDGSSFDSYTIGARWLANGIPTILDNNGIVFEDVTTNPANATLPLPTILDSSFNFVRTLDVTTPYPYNNSCIEEQGNRSVYLSNPILRDSDDNNARDEICYYAMDYCQGNLDEQYLSYLQCYTLSNGLVHLFGEDSILNTTTLKRYRINSFDINSSMRGDEVIVGTKIIFGDNRTTSLMKIMTLNYGFDLFGLTNLYSNYNPDIIAWSNSEIRYYKGQGYSVPIPSVNLQPHFINLTTSPANRIEYTSNEIFFYASGFDNESDTMYWGVDCNFSESHESISYDASTSPYILQDSDFVASKSCALPIGDTRSQGRRFKAYIFDNSHKEWGNFTNPSKIDYLPSGSINVSSVEGFLIFNNTRPINYLKVKVFEYDSTITLDNIKIIITAFNMDGQNRVYKLTSENIYADDSGEAYFTLPNATYFVKAEDTRIPAIYYTTNKTCSTSNTNLTICLIYMNWTGASPPSNYSFSFRIRDSTNGYPIKGVNVSFISPQQLFTLSNNDGIVYIGGLNSTVYDIELRHDNYTTARYYFNVIDDNGIDIFLVQKSTTQTNIILTLKDYTSKARISNAHVTMTNSYSGESYTGFTATDGTFSQKVNLGNSVWQWEIQKDGYLSLIEANYVVEGITNSYTSFLLSSSEFPTNASYTTDRNCQDQIKGIWLCGMRNQHCTSNNDCISGYCNPSKSCSSFNYTWCDDHLRPRNQRCIFVATFNGFMSATADWMLNNFFWLLVIIVLVLGFAMVVILIRTRFRK